MVNNYRMINVNTFIMHKILSKSFHIASVTLTFN